MFVVVSSSTKCTADKVEVGRNYLFKEPRMSDWLKVSLTARGVSQSHLPIEFQTEISHVGSVVALNLATPAEVVVGGAPPPEALPSNSAARTTAAGTGEMTTGVDASLPVADDVASMTSPCMDLPPPRCAVRN